MAAPSNDFPIICETCLGENPYVRMMKAEHDKECKVCSRPFTVFRWRPGGNNARYKKTEICQTCAKLKNVCQTCLLDLEFGLPVQVRDAALAQGGNSSAIQPLSDINREWFTQQAERQIADGTYQYNRIETRNQLMKVARTAPYFKRNAPHVCSFFIKGECNRGASCPYRHELPDASDHQDPELAHQNIRDRYYGKDDPVAKKILGKIASKELVPPNDQNIKTLYLGGLTPDTTEQDIRDIFYSYGEISDVKMLSERNCAFVTYTSRAAAEEAATKLHGNLNIKGKNVKLAWAKPAVRDTPSSNNNNSAPANYSMPTQSQAPTTGAYVPPNPSLGKPQYPSMSAAQFGSKRDR